MTTNKENIQGSYVGNVVEIKISSFELIETKLKEIYNHYEDLSNKLNAFVKLSRNNAADFTNTTNINKVIEYPNKAEARFHDSDGNFLQWVYERAKDVAAKKASDYIVEEKKVFLQHLNDIVAVDTTNIKASLESFNEFANSINRIRRAIDNFEAVKCDFKKRIESFRDYYEGMASTSSIPVKEENKNASFESTNRNYSVNDEKIASVYRDKYVDGDFDLKKSLIEVKNKQLLEDVGSVVSPVSNSSIFSKNGEVVWDESNIQRYKEITGRDWSSEEFSSKEFYAGFEDTDELTNYFPNLASNASGNRGFSMSKTLIESISSNGDVKAVDFGEVKGETYTTSNLASMISTPDNSSKLVGKMVNVDTIKVPKQITQNNANYIDEQAKEIYYSKSPELISAERANALSAVDSAFNGENDVEFRNILSQCYDDVDIDLIMENKELAVTAFILATESKSLTDIANKLASSQGIEDYEPSYTYQYNVASLENGVSQSQLLSEVSEDVNNSRFEVQSIRNKYNESVKKTNESIEEANRRKTEMDETRNKIIARSGEDPSGWSNADIEEYNRVVESYNIANRAANAAYNESSLIKVNLERAEVKLQETQQRVANDYLNGSVEETEQPQTNVNVVEQPVVNENQIPVEQQTVMNAQSDNSINQENPKNSFSSDDLLNLFVSPSDTQDKPQEEKKMTALELSAISPEERTISDNYLREAIFGKAKTDDDVDEAI